MRRLKQFFANKNIVTVLGVILGIGVLYIFYNHRINQIVSPVRVPYAKVTITSRTKITDDMIDYVDVPQDALRGDVLTNTQKQIAGKYTNVGVVIPEGSFFYADVVIDEDELPDSFLVDIPAGNVPYSFGVDVETTYGNSMYPGNFVDIYFKGLEGDKIMLGKLMENVKILAVKDSAGNHVFEGTIDPRSPSQIIFSVTPQMHTLLRSAKYIEDVELILVPTNISYVVEDPESIVTNITSDYIKMYIEQHSVAID